MAWFQKEMDYAGERLSQVAEGAVDRAGERLSQVAETAVERAGERLSGVMAVGIQQAGQELKDVVAGTSREIDAKLDKISQELHHQRQFTKDDVKELVDYAAERLSGVLDDRIQVMKLEISDLVREKTEYFKSEVDAFFIERQRDLARERRRLAINIALAFLASLAVGAVSLFYKGLGEGPVDLLTVFRVVLASLAGGYGVYLAANLMNRWLSMTEHRKDALFLAARYWGWLRPASLFSTFFLFIALGLLAFFLAYPDPILTWLGDWRRFLPRAP